MRTMALFSGDVRFQFKYGFYYIYLFFTMVYIGLLFVLPSDWRQKAAILMIFSDPAAMGLYFMGAIVLLEKSERVLNSIAISPVKPYEYVVSKLCSIGLISVLSAAAIGFFSGTADKPVSFHIGIFLGSCLFSAIGLIVACNISSLNEFVIATIPAELLINFPAIAYLFGYKKSWLLFHPGVSLIEILQGGDKAVPAFILLFLWSLLLSAFAVRTVKKMLQTVGGVKL